MNDEELRQTMKEMHEAFKQKFPKKSDEEIDQMMLDMFFKAFCEDKMYKEDLMAITYVLGYTPREDILDEIEREKRKEHK